MNRQLYLEDETREDQMGEAEPAKTGLRKGAKNWRKFPENWQRRVKLQLQLKGFGYTS